MTHDQFQFLVKYYGTTAIPSSKGGFAYCVDFRSRRAAGIAPEIDLKRIMDAELFAERGAKKESLAPQLQLIYRQQLQEGGRGDEDAILDGELTIGSDRYHVTCRKQSEYAPSATDCLPVLATLRSMR